MVDDDGGEWLKGNVKRKKEGNFPLRENSRAYQVCSLHGALNIWGRSLNGFYLHTKCNRNEILDNCWAFLRKLPWWKFDGILI